MCITEQNVLEITKDSLPNTATNNKAMPKAAFNSRSRSNPDESLEQDNADFATDTSPGYTPKKPWYYSHFPWTNIHMKCHYAKNFSRCALRTDGKPLSKVGYALAV